MGMCCEKKMMIGLKKCMECVVEGGSKTERKTKEDLQRGCGKGLSST